MRITELFNVQSIALDVAAAADQAPSLTNSLICRPPTAT